MKLESVMAAVKVSLPYVALLVGGGGAVMSHQNSKAVEKMQAAPTVTHKSETRILCEFGKLEGKLIYPEKKK